MSYGFYRGIELFSVYLFLFYMNFRFFSYNHLFSDMLISSSQAIKKWPRRAIFL